MGAVLLPMTFDMATVNEGCGSTYSHNVLEEEKMKKKTVDDRKLTKIRASLKQ